MKLDHAIFTNYLKLVLKKVNFLWESIDEGFSPPIKPDKPFSSPLFPSSHDFKQFKQEKNNGNIKEDPESNENRKEIIANLMDNDFFKTLAPKKTPKQLEKLFPSEIYQKPLLFKSPSTIPLKDPKHCKIANFLPKPSFYIEAYLKGQPPPSTKTIYSPIELIKESDKEELERILGTELGNLIGFFNYEEETKANEQILSLLISKGLFSKAISLFEDRVSDPKRMDSIIIQYLNTKEYEGKTAKEKLGFLKKLSCLKEAGLFLKQLIENSEFEISQEVIEFWWQSLEKNSFSNEKLVIYLNKQAKKILTVKSLKLSHYKWTSLAGFDADMKDFSKEILSSLLSNHQYTAVKELIELESDLTKDFKGVSELQLVYNLTNNPIIENFILFHELNDIKASRRIIDKIPNLSTKLTLNRLLLIKIKDSFIKTEISNEILSLEILIELTPFTSNLKSLILSPKSLILYLIHYKKVSLLTRIKPQINRLFLDTEILDYAKTQSLGFFRGLKGLYPDFSFFKDLVSLCEDQNLVAEACLTIADELSCLLSSSLMKKYQFLLLELTKKHIVLARKVFKKLDFRLENQKRCEKYLYFLEIRESFLKMSLNYPISLKQFFSDEEVQKLLTFLLKRDYLRSALQICEKCDISPCKVLLKWILWLLRFEQFEKAHEILAKNLEFFDSALSQAEMHQILSTLEASPFVNSSTFLSLQKDLAFSHVLFLKQGQIKKLSLSEHESKEKAKKAFENTIFSECVFFLKNYGTPQQFINFHVQKGLLEEACRYYLSHITLKII